MNYINKIFLGLLVVATAFVCSCGDGTETLTPGDPFVNYYDVDPSDKSLSGNLRRNFYESTGVYLLYTDILASYTDSYGIDRVETVDFGWSLDDANTTIRWEFDELTDDEKEMVTDLVMKYFIPYINVEGGSLKPYSIMLVKNLLTNKEDAGYMEESDFISCQRCFAANMTDWIDADSEDAKVLSKLLLRSLVDTKLNDNSPGLEPFFDICADCYENYYISRQILEWIDNQDMELIYEQGFMSYYPDWWDEPEYDSFPSKNNDLKSFMDVIFNQSEDEFMEEWSEYPVIVQKYEILKECIENLGIDLNAVE